MSITHKRKNIEQQIILSKVGSGNTYHTNGTLFNITTSHYIFLSSFKPTWLMAFGNSRWCQTQAFRLVSIWGNKLELSVLAQEFKPDVWEGGFTFKTSCELSKGMAKTSGHGETNFSNYSDSGSESS